MKKVIMIVGGLAVLLVGGITALAYWTVLTQEKEKNKAKTANANASRWSRKQAEEENPNTPVTDEAEKKADN